MTPHRPASRCSSRRGAVLVWFVFVIPLMLLLLLALTDFAGASLAKIELKNTVDAAALSAIKTWGTRGATAAAVDANTLIIANTQTSGILSRALTTPADAPDDDTTNTVVTFGVLQDLGGRHLFVPLRGSEAAAMTGNLCVSVKRTVVVPSLGGNWLGLSFGPYAVTAESFARLSPLERLPQLVAVDGVAWEQQP